MTRASHNKIVVIALKLMTSVQFTSENPILLKGQEGYELDTRKRKVGDGITAWNDLQYDVASSTGGSTISTLRRNWFRR